MLLSFFHKGQRMTKKRGKMKKLTDRKTLAIHDRKSFDQPKRGMEKTVPHILQAISCQDQTQPGSSTFLWLEAASSRTILDGMTLTTRKWMKRASS